MELWGPQAAGFRLCACDCYNSSYVLSCPVFQALESRLPVHGNLTTALSTDEKTEAWRCEVRRPKRPTQEVVEPVSSSLQAEPVFLSEALCPRLPIQGSPTHTRAGARQTKEVAREEVAESGGVWGKPESQIGVAVCHTGTRSQPPPESQGKLETQDCMGNVQGLKLGSVKIPLAT